MRARIAVLAALAGCGGGVKFVDSALNSAQFPPELKERQVFKSAGVYVRNLSGLVGHVLYAKKTNGQCPNTYADADLSLKQYLVANTKLEPDNKVERRFEAKIDKGAAVDANYLAFATSLDTKQVAEVLVTDTVSLIVPDSGIPVQELEQLAQQPLGPDDCDRFYIRGAIITTIVYKIYNERSAKGTATGAAFGANGKVYSTDSMYSLDYKLGVSVLPVRAGVNALHAGGANPGAFKDINISEDGLRTRNP